MPKILVVEDDAVIRRMLSGILVKMGHEVAAAGDGVEALRLLDTAPFDIVITDLIMPEMEGLQLIRELRQRKAPQKIIAMSGGGRNSAEDYLDIAKMLSADTTLEKPFTVKAVADAISRVMVSAQ